MPDEARPEQRAEREARSPVETEVSALHPLTIHLDRETLIDAVEAALVAIKQNAKWQERDFQGRIFVRGVIQQRVEFLEWLHRDSKQPTVLVAMYPADDAETVGIDDTVPSGEAAEMADFDLFLKGDPPETDDDESFRI